MKLLILLGTGFAVAGMCLGATAAVPVSAPVQATPAASSASSGSWSFVVSGDSRNCGDLIMPAIARGAHQRNARFYWHLGDLRALFEVDEDYAGFHHLDIAQLKLNLLPPSTMNEYLKNAWPDFVEHQIKPFGKTPFFLGVGNHEIIKNSEAPFLDFFHDQLNLPPIRAQREADSPGDNAVHAYYHWRERGVEFIYLDNSMGVFDEAQLQWFNTVVAKVEADAGVVALVVGMHESLPYSYSVSHSMNEASDKGASGLVVYQRLLDYRKKGKPVYILSSHSHYYLADDYNTSYWQAHGGALPGYLIGAGGAQHYSVPPEVKSFAEYAENAYGYVVATVHPGAAGLDPISFRFVPVTKADLLPETVRSFGAQAVKFCFSANYAASVPGTNYCEPHCKPKSK